MENILKEINKIYEQNFQICQENYGRLASILTDNGRHDFLKKYPQNTIIEQMNITDKIIICNKYTELITDWITKNPQYIKSHTLQSPYPFTNINGLNVANPHIFTCSDHLPVIREISINGQNIRFGSWNTLYQKWLINNARSDQHIGKYFPHLATMSQNVREGYILTIIKNLFEKHDVHIMGLQELNPNEINKLKSALHPFGILCIVPQDLQQWKTKEETNLSSNGNNDLQVVLYNSRKFTYDLNKSHMTYYHVWNVNKTQPQCNITYPPESCFTSTQQEKINKRIMNISFSINNKEFRFINTHVIYGGTRELIDYVNSIKIPQNYSGQYDIVVVGDMNVPNLDFGAGTLTDNGLHVLVGTQLFNSSYSHIDTDGNQIILDHIWNFIK